VSAWIIHPTASKLLVERNLELDQPPTKALHWQVGAEVICLQTCMRDIMTFLAFRGNKTWNFQFTECSTTQVTPQRKVRLPKLTTYTIRARNIQLFLEAQSLHFVQKTSRYRILRIACWDYSTLSHPNSVTSILISFAFHEHVFKVVKACLRKNIQGTFQEWILASFGLETFISSVESLCDTVAMDFAFRYSKSKIVFIIQTRGYSG